MSFRLPPQKNSGTNGPEARGVAQAAPGGEGQHVEVTGVVERILFSNAETNYAVAELRHENGGLVIIQGALPGLQCGETVWAQGNWKAHPQFGRQIAVKRHEVRLPASIQGMRKFLGSGMIPGVGKGLADKIVDRFGVDTLRVLSEESGRLREVPGIGEKRGREIKAAWDEQRAMREVMLFLQTYGVGVRQCMRIVRAYGASAPALLRSDPYLLAREIDGIGFKTADRIALNLGLANDSDQRLDAGLIHIMQELELDGSTAIDIDTLAVEGARLLRSPKDKVAARVAELLRRRELVDLSTLAQLPGTAYAEQRTAEALLRLAGAPSGLPPIKTDAAVDWAQQRAGFSFAPEQADAIRAALTHKLTVLTGGPGTGKTSILRAIVDILQAKKVKVLLASPTGRAAQRLAESTGVEAVTLHRLLRFNAQNGGFDIDQDTPLNCDFVIVDEASMLDARLASALARGIPVHAHLLLVGDADQLPSVGAGNVLADVSGSGLAVVAPLRRIFRQSEGSAIVRTAHAILAGDGRLPPLIDGSAIDRRSLPEIGFIQAKSAEDCAATVVRLCAELEGRGIERTAIQVLAPMHKGQGGIQALNRALQAELNLPEGPEIVAGDSIYRQGDKVIQTRNDYDRGVFNGDIGTVTAVIPQEGAVTADFASVEASFARMELVDLQLAYAISIHKSQGSEFHYVIVPLLKQHFMLLQRNLIYTAVTRAKKAVVIVGEPEAYQMAVERDQAAQRVTTLRHRIRRAMSGLKN